VSSNARLRSDTPLVHAAEDLLGLERLAEGLASLLEPSLDAGLLASAWAPMPGAGRTSLLNLLHSALQARGACVARVDGARVDVAALRAFLPPSGRSAPIVLVDDAQPEVLAELDAAGMPPLFACWRADSAQDAAAAASPLMLELPPWSADAAARLATRLTEDAREQRVMARVLAAAATPREAHRMANAVLAAFACDARPRLEALDALARAVRGEAVALPAGAILAMAKPASAPIEAAAPDASELESDDVEVARRRCQEIARRGGDEAARDLSLLVADARAGVRLAACEALVASDVAAGHHLRPHLAHAQPAVRRAAAFVLGRLRDVEARADLAHLLHDASADVRGAAAAALGQLGEPACVPARVGALREPHARVRLCAETALSRLIARFADHELRRMHEPVATLAGLVDGGRPDLRLAATHALGLLGDDSAVDVLLRAHDDADPRLRQAAAMSLVRLGHARRGVDPG